MNTEQIQNKSHYQNINCLCIPRVLPNIFESQIKKIFIDLEIGYIEHIHIVSNLQNKEKYNRVFIHIKFWFNNQNAITARERLEQGKEIKIFYDNPWFWKVSAYREKQ